MYKSPELDTIRKKIDSLDNQLHDLLMERADLIMTISAEKKKQGIQIVQPAREARMIRRLMDRHREPLPEEAIVRIWRELVSCVSLLQTGLKVAVCVPPETPEYWDMARDYFGSVLPMHKTTTPLSALHQVIDGKVNFAVLPYPETEEAAPWWPLLMESMGEGVHILQRLPYGDKENYTYNNHPALIVAKAGFDTSDDDHSFIGLELSPDISRAKIAEKAKEVGLTPVFMYAKPSSGPRNLHLIEVTEYIAKTSDKLKALQESLGDPEGKISVIGGYPSPLIYKSRKKDIEAA
jgi:chorismate mutase/prephenate dehydratase